MSAFGRMSANGARVLTIGLFLAAALGGPALGQGFGPDPFRPLNNQFDPYVYPMGPAGPGAGQSVGANSSFRGANQFQNYMNELQGIGRQRTEKYGIGMPYYRSSVDPEFSRRRGRDYEPNRRTQRTFEESQQLITDKYLAFMAERDPKKRATLFRDYEGARQRSLRSLSTRRTGPSSVVERAQGLEDDLRPLETKRSARSGTAAGARERAGEKPSSELRATPGNRPVPPPPPSLRQRSRSASPAAAASRTPSATLERARALEHDSDRPAAKGANRAPRTGSSPVSPPPSAD